jgi:type II secretory pathway pseudopilin PulG
MRGQTLLEIVVAVAILGGTLATLCAAMSGHIFRASDAARHRAARSLCRAKLAEATLRLAQAGSGDYEEEEDAPIYPGFRWRIEEEDESVGESGEQVVRLTVTVTYPIDDTESLRESGSVHSVTLEDGGSGAEYTLATFIPPEEGGE